MTIEEIQVIQKRVRTSDAGAVPDLDFLLALWEIALQLAVQNRQIAVYTDMMDEAKKRGDSAIKEMIAVLLQELEKTRTYQPPSPVFQPMVFISERCPHCGMPNPRSAGILGPRAKELIEKGVCPNCQQSLDADAAPPVPRDAHGNPIDLDD